jgi:hypothetical protein
MEVYMNMSNNSIGGSLSLFLGVSAFSFCEVAEVMIEIYFVVKNKRHL